MTGSRLYVRLGRDTEKRTVEKAFGKYGDIDDIDMKYGYAFVQFHSSRDADDALDALNGTRLDGYTLVVEHSRPDSKRGSSRDECFKCGRSGHWARNCPSARRRSRSRSRSRSPRRRRHSRSRSRSRSRSPSRSRSRRDRSRERRSRRDRSRSRSKSRSRSASRSPRRGRDRKSKSRSRSRSRSPPPKKDRSPSPARGRSRSPSPSKKSRSPSPARSRSRSRSRSANRSPMKESGSPARRGDDSPKSPRGDE